jgi:hypothetical protein
MAAIYRYQWRVLSFYWFMREPCPAFDFTSSDVDTGTDPAALTIPYPDRLSSSPVGADQQICISRETRCLASL